ncbi:hypothetical protein MBLNU13_g04203t2 [Cladosporium sp. NU13]
MPAIPGENLLTTLFTDVHYYFNDPSSRPLHHRFSKGSYTYLYHNPTEHRAKLEIANHAGTPEQDAFFGSLNAVKSLVYSHKQPTLFIFVLDQAAIATQGEWHLGAYDEHNQQKYLYKIHTIDLYLWTEKDAATLLGHLQNIMPLEKLDIRHAPASSKASLAEHRDSMSPVVQQLEKTAIGTHFHPRAESTASVHSFPGPPASAQSGGVAVSPPPAQQQLHQPAPMAYNPAAPIAPEPIAHREKTPPPVDDASGSGVPSAVGYGSTQYATLPHGFQPSFQPSMPNTPQQSYFSGPPQAQPRQSSYGNLPGPPQGTPPNNIQRTQSGSLPPPPPPPGQTGPSPAQYTTSFGPPPTGQSTQPSSPPPNQTSFNRQSSFGQPVQQFASYPPQSPGFLNHQPQQQQQQQPPTPSAPPSYNTHTPLASPGLPPQQQAAQIAGYSSFSYNSTQQAQPGAYNAQGAYAGDVHNQLYRPTEQESAAQLADKSKMPYVPPQPGQERKDSFSGKYKVNERVDKVEKGVGRFLKKLDSKW